MQSVLVVIPTLNEAGSIADVIDDLGRDAPQDARLSFVVVDGGSTDGTTEIVRRLARKQRGVTLLDNPGRIQSAGVNRAVRIAGDGVDVLVRCDAHAAYPPGFIRRLLETLERTGADSVVVAMDSTGGESCLERAIGWASDMPIGSGGSAHRAGCHSGFVDHGHHAAFRMASFRRCGGYDESFTHNEDAELDCRQRRLGARIYLDAGIRIGYRPRASLRALAKQYFLYGKGRSRTVRRHRGSMRARQIALPLNLAALTAAFAVAPWWPAALAWPLAYGLILAFASAFGAIRRASLCGLLIGPASAVMHLSWATGFVIGLAGVREPAWPGSVPAR